jgi:hypothetical protein
MGLVTFRRSWRLVLLAAVIMRAVGGVVAWTWVTVGGSRDTVSILLQPSRHGVGQATVSVRRGQVADPGAFARRLVASIASSPHGSAVRSYTDLLGRRQMVDVDLAIPASSAPLRVNTHAIQQMLAEEGFGWLVVGLYSGDHYQVTPDSAAVAGKCFGNALSCEWRLPVHAPPLNAELIAM